jgi:hypothetical protein
MLLISFKGTVDSVFSALNALALLYSLNYSFFLTPWHHPRFMHPKFLPPQSAWQFFVTVAGTMSVLFLELKKPSQLPVQHSVTLESKSGATTRTSSQRQSTECAKLWRKKEKGNAPVAVLKVASCEKLSSSSEENKQIS